MKRTALTSSILGITAISTLAVVSRAFGQTAPAPQPMSRITLELAKAVGAPANPQPAQDVGKIEKLPGLYRVTEFGGPGCVVYLILTPEPVLIDCGCRMAWDELIGNIKLAGVQPDSIRLVIATHGHWDHVDAMACFQRNYPNVKFAIHAGDAQSVINNDRVFSCVEMLTKGLPSDSIKVDRILLDGDMIQVGRNTFRIVHTPGHTPGSITVVTEIAGKKVGFCGDSVVGYYSLANRSSVIDWETSMRKLLAQDLDLLFTGHSNDPVAGKAAIQDYLMKALDAASYKRRQQALDEMYQDLEYSMENGKQSPTSALERYQQPSSKPPL